MKRPESPFIGAIKERMFRENDDYRLAIVGPTGRGKSWAALRLAADIDPKFNVDEQVVFTSKEFMRLINSGQLKRGQVIIWDEAGVERDNRKWYSRINILINHVLQTVRHRNLCIIFTVPVIAYLDKKDTQMFHAIIEMKSINKNKGLSRGQYFITQVDHKRGKIYYKYPRISIDGVPTILHHILIRKPPKRVRESYEIKKKAFTKFYYEYVEKQLEEPVRKKRRRQKIDYKGIAADIKKKKADYIIIRGARQYLSIAKIMMDYDLGDTSAKRIKAYVEQDLEIGGWG